MADTLPQSMIAPNPEEAESQPSRKNVLGIFAIIAAASFGIGAYGGLQVDRDETATVAIAQANMQQAQSNLLGAIDDKYPASAASIGSNCYNKLMNVASYSFTGVSFEANALKSIPVLEDCGGLEAAISTATDAETSLTREAVTTFEAIRVGLDRKYDAPIEAQASFDPVQVAQTETKIDIAIMNGRWDAKEAQDTLTALDANANTNETLLYGAARMAETVAFAGLALFVIKILRRKPRKQS